MCGDVMSYLMLASAIVLGGVSVACYVMLRRAFRAYRSAEESVRGLAIGIFGRLRKVEEAVEGIPRGGGVEEVLERVKRVEGEVKRLSEALSKFNARMAEFEEALRSSSGATARAPARPVEAGGLTPTEARILRLLASEGPMTASQLGERVGRSREHVSRLLKKLFEAGLIERDVSEIPYRYSIRDEGRELVGS